MGSWRNGAASWCRTRRTARTRRPQQWPASRSPRSPRRRTGRWTGATIEGELDDSVAAVMVTVPNTLGLWEQGIEEVAGLIHDAGAYLYGDGANLNAIMGRVRFGDLGVDVVHLNLHKSFSTPHGGGGPGSGPVCCSPELALYLPSPVVTECDDGVVRLTEPERSIGRLQQFHGKRRRAHPRLRLHARSRPRGPASRFRSGRAQRQLPARADGWSLRPAVRPAGAARGRLLGHAPASGPRRAHLRHRQAPHRPRLPPADGVLPADRRGSVDDRADRDRAPRGDRSPGRPP